MILEDPQNNLQGEHLNKIKAKYQELYSNAPKLENCGLKDHLKNVLLPGAALYMVITSECMSSEEAKVIVNRFYEAAMVNRRRMLHLLGRLPFYPWLLKFLTPRLMKYQYPSPGWEIEFIETSQKRVALTMHKCFYVDILNHFGIADLASLYCDLDNYMNDEMSPYIEWRRTKTLGYGDDCCDFEFHNVKFLDNAS